jgi:hypothetical protein
MGCFFSMNPPPFIAPKYNVNSDSYRHRVDFKLFKLEGVLPSIN